MNNRTAHIAAIATAIAGTVGSAHAGPVNFGFEGLGSGQNLNISVGYDGGDLFAGRVFAGSILHRVEDVSMRTFCIDPEQPAQVGVTNFERVRLDRGLMKRDFAFDRSRVLAELADIAGDSIWSTSANSLNSAAFQVAAWEVVSDFDSGLGAKSFDFNSGFFRGSGNDKVFSAASELLGQLTFKRVDASGYDAFLHGTHQDFMGKSVPAPAGLALIAAGVPLSLKRRRRASR